MKTAEKDKIFIAVSVNDRLPEKPVKQSGGQQVNHIHRNYGIEKVVLLDNSKGCGEMSIFSFHYLSKKWYAQWDCRSMIVDETKYKDVTDIVTHWLDEIASQFKPEMPTDNKTLELAFDAGRETIDHPDWDYVYETFDDWMRDLISKQIIK